VYTDLTDTVIYDAVTYAEIEENDMPVRIHGGLSVATAFDVVLRDRFPI
jgi:hypothetical protein